MYSPVSDVVLLSATYLCVAHAAVHLQRSPCDMIPSVPFCLTGSHELRFIMKCRATLKDRNRILNTQILQSFFHFYKFYMHTSYHHFILSPERTHFYSSRLWILVSSVHFQPPDRRKIATPCSCYAH